MTADDPVTGQPLQGGDHFDIEVSKIDPKTDMFIGTAGYWLGPVADNNWHTVTIKDNFSSSNNGLVQLWWDGVPQNWTNTGSPVLSGVVTLPFGQIPYGLDIDQYRAAALSGTYTVWHGFRRLGRHLQA